MRLSAIGVIAGLGIMAMGAVQAGAATIVRDFSFLNAQGTVIANGSFGYDSADPNAVLGFSDLSSFSVTEYIDGQATTYALAYVDTLTPGTDDVYFGYDTATNTFDPGAVSDSGGQIGSILALDKYDASAISGADTGIFVEPLPYQGEVDGTASEGTIYVYPGTGSATAASFSISAIPEPPVWCLLLTGLAILGLAQRDRRMNLPRMVIARTVQARR
jgi:hypothetical protein